MSDEAERFRKRAKQCRVLASQARDDDSRNELGRMADDLDAEAAKIDQEEATPDDA